jgi:hypothetical protein
MPRDATLEAVRAIYDKYPWSTTLEPQDLSGLIFDMKFLPYRPTSGDIYGAVEALSIEQGRPVDELQWHEVRQVFGYRLIMIRPKATLRISGRVIGVEE